MDKEKQPSVPGDSASVDRERKTRPSFAFQKKALGAVVIIIVFVLWSHLGSGVQVFHPMVSFEPGWHQFQATYGIDNFGQDGNFVRAVNNGYNLVFYTHKYARRFTRKTVADRINACAACHTAEELAYSFVNSDRFDTKLGKRVSFEERVMRCYAGPMDGYVPTIHDPAVRDIRLFARAVAHHLQLGEGALRNGN